MYLATEAISAVIVSIEIVRKDELKRNATSIRGGRSTEEELVDHDALSYPLFDPVRSFEQPVGATGSSCQFFGFHCS